MGNHEIVSYFKKGKIVQLAAVIIVAVCFFLLLICNSSLRNNIYTNSGLFTMCAFIWILLILYLIGIFYDFYKLNTFNNAEEKSAIQKYMDESSGMLNRFSCDSLFNSDEVKEVLAKVGCAMIEIKNLKEINENAGRDAGDTAIADFSDILESVGNDYGIVVRNGGNEFLIVIADCSKEVMDKCLEEMENSIALYNEAEGPNPLDIHSTVVLNSEKNYNRFSEILTQAYKQLHNA